MNEMSYYANNDPELVHELEDLGASNFDGPRHLSLPPRPRSIATKLPQFDSSEAKKGHDGSGSSSKSKDEPARSLLQLPPADLRNFSLLCLLYLLQGVPVGLAMGSVPFLLKSKLSYGQVGLFSLASYPYSMKLLWSPIVDAIYSRRIGRRKSWIVPIQTVSSLMLLWLGAHVDDLLEDVRIPITPITLLKVY